MQLELLEPTPNEAPALALAQLRRAAAYRRAADIFRSRGWDQREADHRRRAADHEDEAECLAMYADLCFLGGLA